MSGGSDDANQSWTVLELLKWTTDFFAREGVESARLDAEVLLAYALDMSRLDLYLNYEKPLVDGERATFRDLVAKRGRERIPVSQLVGEREFWSLPIRVTPDVLTPRPETEVLVEAGLRALPDLDAPYRVLDLGTGTGAIALAIARERPRAEVTATDISAPALKVARENAEKLQLNERIRFAEGSLFEAVKDEHFDLILSNPPYLARSEQTSLPPELRHEPDTALFGGSDGYAVLRPLVMNVVDMLVPGGGLAVELDPSQAGTVSDWCREAGLEEVETLRDLAQRQRVVRARRGNTGIGA